MAGVDLGMDFTQAEAESLDQARRQVAEMLDVRGEARRAGYWHVSMFVDRVWVCLRAV